MRALVLVLAALLAVFIAVQPKPVWQPVVVYPVVADADPCFNPVATYEGEADDDLADVMVPIPHKDRVFNKTGIQCVWCSIECCGRYAEIAKLINLTEQPDCKSYSDPAPAAHKLRQLGVKFEQTTSADDRHLILKSIVKERRGCLFDVPRHAMNLVHYDEKKGIVKYINNSDRSLRVRTWTMDEFNRRWQGWLLVVYGEPDIIPNKYLPNLFIPIIDRNNNQGQYQPGYILRP